jgi:hypothetical protein
MLYQVELGIQEKVSRQLGIGPEKPPGSHMGLAVVDGVDGNGTACPEIPER